MNKATLKAIFLIIGISLNCADCGVLLWGSKNIQIPSLKQFNNEDLDILTNHLDQPKLVVFMGDPMNASDKLEALLKNKHTAYIPNSNLNIYGLIALNGNAEENYVKIESELSKYESENILALIVSKNDRIKREIETTTEMTDDEDISYYEQPKGPILYSAKGTAMIYSSKPPILITNATKLTLGKAAIGSLDNRQQYTRLSVTIPVSEGKILLRFKFLWNLGYWTLSSTELLDMESKTYTLTLGQDVTASKNFSYHCSGETVFVDETNKIKLILYDIQAQPDSQKGRFNDAYDCVSFMTAPIWSGLFVTSILIVVLGIGLGALNSIKTMDKFDNAKTKQLNIMIFE